MSNKVEQELKEPSDLLQSVFNSAPNSIAVMQTVYSEDGKVEDFTILLLNAYTLTVTGDIDYKGKRYSDVFPMVKQTGILDKFREVAETGVTANFKRWYAGEGMNHWFCFTAVKQGELLVVTTEDITAAKKAEEALRASEEFNRTVLESSPDCLKVLDVQGRLTYMNYNGTCVMEIDDFNTLKNKSWWDLWPDDSKGEVKSAVARALKGKTAQFQAFCPTAKGTPKWWDVVVSPIAGSDGAVSQLISVSRDITETRKAEETVKLSESRFRTLVEEAPMAACLFTGRELTIALANELMLQSWGKTPAVIGKTLREAMPELDGQPFFDVLDQVFISGETYQNAEAPAHVEVNGEMVTYYFNSLAF